MTTEELEACKAELYEVLRKYPGAYIAWTCDSGSDTFGISGDHVILCSEYGCKEVSLDDYEEEP